MSRTPWIYRAIACVSVVLAAVGLTGCKSLQERYIKFEVWKYERCFGHLPPGFTPNGAIPPQVAAPAVPAAPAASSEESRGVLDNFPHVGPAFAEPSAPAPEDNAEAAARHEAEWRKAFAFVGQTDNPVVGNNGQANTLQVAGSVQQSSAQAISSSGSSPLDDDGFLKGFWGSS